MARTERSRVLPPMPGHDRDSADSGTAGGSAEKAEKAEKTAVTNGQERPESASQTSRSRAASSYAGSSSPQQSPAKQEPARTEPAHAAEPVQTTSIPVAQRRAPRTRKAQLRLVHVDPWSVMKTSFLLSIAIGIISVVAVGIIWGVLGAAGVWDSVNSMVDQTVGSDTSTPFNITHYIGTSRMLGFTMIAAVIDVVLITAIATLGAFVYNLAATLVGGVEVTLAEDR